MVQRGRFSKNWRRIPYELIQSKIGAVA